jgi:hypothetical protein
MSILSFEKPKKARSTTEHNDTYQSDTNIAGTYVPNMSEEDRLKWKAKHIAGSDPRVEIRKTVVGREPNSQWGHSAQILIIVRPSLVIMSANSRMIFDSETWKELSEAVAEAQEKLRA